MLAAAIVSAVATSVLAVFAVVTAVFAIMAFRKQSIEVGVLVAERRREAEQRHRAQATQVFTWPGQAALYEDADIRDAAFVRNTSSQPVFDVSIGWGGSGHETLPTLMPGDQHVARGAGTSAAKGTYAEFRDAAGTRWRTTSAGDLTELYDQTSASRLPAAEALT